MKEAGKWVKAKKAAGLLKHIRHKCEHPFCAKASEGFTTAALAASSDGRGGINKSPSVNSVKLSRLGSEGGVEMKKQDVMNIAFGDNGIDNRLRKHRSVTFDHANPQNDRSRSGRKSNSTGGRMSHKPSSFVPADDAAHSNTSDLQVRTASGGYYRGKKGRGKAGGSPGASGRKAGFAKRGAGGSSGSARLPAVSESRADLTSRMQSQRDSNDDESKRQRSVVSEATNENGRLNCKGCVRMTWRGIQREHEVISIVYNKDIWMTKAYRLKVLAVLCLTAMWVQAMVYSQKYSKDGAFSFIKGGDGQGLLIYLAWGVFSSIATVLLNTIFVNLLTKAAYAYRSAFIYEKLGIESVQCKVIFEGPLYRRLNGLTGRVITAGSTAEEKAHVVFRPFWFRLETITNLQVLAFYAMPDAADLHRMPGGGDAEREQQDQALTAEERPDELFPAGHIVLTRDTNIQALTMGDDGSLNVVGSFIATDGSRRNVRGKREKDDGRAESAAIGAPGRDAAALSLEMSAEQEAAQAAGVLVATPGNKDPRKGPVTPTEKLFSASRASEMRWLLVLRTSIAGMGVMIAEAKERVEMARGRLRYAMRHGRSWLLKKLTGVNAARGLGPQRMALFSHQCKQLLQLAEKQYTMAIQRQRSEINDKIEKIAVLQDLGYGGTSGLNEWDSSKLSVCERVWCCFCRRAHSKKAKLAAEVAAKEAVNAKGKKKGAYSASFRRFKEADEKMAEAQKAKTMTEAATKTKVREVPGGAGATKKGCLDSYWFNNACCEKGVRAQCACCGDDASTVGPLQRTSSWFGGVSKSGRWGRSDADFVKRMTLDEYLEAKQNPNYVPKWATRQWLKESTGVGDTREAEGTGKSKVVSKWESKGESKGESKAGSKGESKGGAWSDENGKTWFVGASKKGLGKGGGDKGGKAAEEKGSPTTWADGGNGKQWVVDKGVDRGKGKGNGKGKEGKRIDTLTATENRSENVELSLQYNTDHMARLRVHQSATQAKLRKETVLLLTAVENLRGEHAELPVQERMKRYVYGVLCCVCVVLRVYDSVYCVCSKRASNNVMHCSFPSQISRGSAATHPHALHAVPMEPVDGQARVGEHQA